MIRVIVKSLVFSAGCLLVLAAGATPAVAAPAIAPEIDAASIGSAVTLLAGGYLVLRSRIGRK